MMDGKVVQEHGCGNGFLSSVSNICLIHLFICLFISRQTVHTNNKQYKYYFSEKKPAKGDPDNKNNEGTKWYNDKNVIISFGK